MHFIFLGTAASEGYPNAFCACENCERARQEGGPSLRKRSAALIDGELLIDLGPDLMAASMQHGVSLAKLRYCLQTHEHADHLDPHHFFSRSAYCGVTTAPRLHYYASSNALRRAAQNLRLDATAAESSGEVTAFNVQLYPIAPFQRWEAGPYQVTSLQANHAPETTAMLYLIEREGRVIFYATDTGELPQETWEALARFGKPLDLVVMDHTFGDGGRSTGHINAEQFMEQITRLRQSGLLSGQSRVFATHLAHHSNPTHPALVALAAQRGYEVAYDGLAIDV